VSPTPRATHASPLRDQSGAVPDPALRTQNPELGTDEELRFQLYDAIAHHPEIAGLSAQACERLGRLRSLLDGLARSVGVLPLAELVERTVEGAGYRRELTARGDFDSRLALLNIGKLVELARQFQGADGTLSGFVEYVQYALESGGEEAEVRPVDEGSDAVKVMSVHQAKGLEFPVVFVPGLAEKIFPDPRIDDPDRWDQFPDQLRGDRSRRDVRAFREIPADKATTQARKEAAREREMEEERRLFYVALTRAQQTLFLSRAWWYFTNSKARNGSPFWDEVVDAKEDGVPISTPLGEEEVPPANPRLQGNGALTGQKAEGMKSRAGLLLVEDRGASWISQVAETDHAQWQKRRAEVDRRLALLGEESLAGTALPSVETSCTGLLQYDECPRLFRYLQVDRLPERPSPSAALGIEVHRLIEEFTQGDDQDGAGDREWDMEAEEVERADGQQIEATPMDLLGIYRRSRYGRRLATRMEEDFTLPLGPNLLRGRVDRLDLLPNGSWEMVDFKSGRFPGRVDRRYRLQLQLYSLAAWQLWGIEPDRLSCHLFFLASDHDEALHFSGQELRETEAWALERLDRIRQGIFPRTEHPEPCLRCGYGQVCTSSLDRH
ncbi:MAG TPA: PD-(D/E)XK nuclease family protein, partial [Chloroflexota bacterium]|nr:PD-(D/E)XK nuclease family protein [Chloroflexota bacterium]